ncbi:MAG TPA: AI-2E family transporter, partial [Acidobacteriota bacterium]|nr:AI-2E family transporter [Acidobacteriota bacterium]
SKEILVSTLSVATTITGNIVTSVPGTFVSITFFLLAFYFRLTDGTRLVEFLHENLPFAKADLDILFRTVENICEGVMLGALTAGVIQGFIIGLGYWIFGIPQPFLFGVLTVILSFIPLFGTLPTALGGVIYLLFHHRVGAAIGFGSMFLAASISDNIVKPWVLKGRSQLHPLLGLISVLGGLKVFGFAGIFLGPTIVALTINLIELRRKRHEGELLKAKAKESSTT